MENRYYVYTHRRESDGKIFYVGKGTGRRAFNFTHRSELWKRHYAKHGCRVEIVFNNLPEVCALSVEKAMIASIGRGQLANLSDGGEGVSNPSAETRRLKSKRFSGTGNPQHDPIVYVFWNEAYGKIACTKHTFRKCFGLESPNVSQLVNGGLKTLKGWRLYDNREIKAGKSGPNKSTLLMDYLFTNEDGRIFRGNPHDFCKKFSLDKANVYKLRTGRIDKYKGWVVDRAPE